MSKFKLKKLDWVLIIIFQVVLEMVFLWGIDISLSALINQGYLVNGIFVSNPVLVYHIALYGSILNFVALAFISARHLLRGVD